MHKSSVDFREVLWKHGNGSARRHKIKYSPSCESLSRKKLLLRTECRILNFSIAGGVNYGGGQGKKGQKTYWRKYRYKRFAFYSIILQNTCLMLNQIVLRGLASVPFSILSKTFLESFYQCNAANILKGSYFRMQQKLVCLTLQKNNLYLKPSSVGWAAPKTG